MLCQAGKGVAGAKANHHLLIQIQQHHLSTQPKLSSTGLKINVLKPLLAQLMLSRGF